MDPEASEPGEHKEAPDSGPGFEYDDRPVRDIVWTVLFVVLVGLTCGFGIYAGVNKNDHASQLFKKEYHTNADYCSGGAGAPSGNPPISENTATDLVLGSDLSQTRVLQQDAATTAVAAGQAAFSENDSSFLEFLEHSWVWILAATGAAVAMGFIFVLLFSYFAAVMVYMVAALLIFVPLAAGVILLTLFNDSWGWAYVIAGVLIAIPILCLHKQLSLTSKLLDLGADGIRDNLDLVLFSICTNLVALGCITGLLCFGILALTNGSFDPNNSLNLDKFPEECVNVLGFETDCCDWNFDNWVTGYWVLILVMLVWVIFLINQIRVYVVAGVVSQWYFADEDERGNMSIFKSLRFMSLSLDSFPRSLCSCRFALGPSFGSLVLSSMILTISNIIRRISEWLAKKSQEENSRFKWLVTCLTCLIGVIAHIIEWVTDFATVRMAVTGESFFTAGKNVVYMMTHNLVNAYAIWYYMFLTRSLCRVAVSRWFPPIVLFVCSFLMSISSSVVLALAARNEWNDDEELTNVRAWSWYLFFVCFILIMSILHFFSTLLIDAVNTIFVCFAIDRENKTEKNPKAHEVFASLGLIGGSLAAQAATGGPLATQGEAGV